MAPLKKKIRVVHNGISDIPFLDRKAAQKVLQEKDSSLTNGFWIGTVAELHPVKGLSLAIQSIEKIVREDKNVHYIVVGEGEIRTSLEAEIKKRTLEGQVHLVGFIENAQAHLKAFDLFLIPSLSEGLSYALLEAGMAQLPVIASKTGGIPEVIRDGVEGSLVQPGDVLSLTTALHTLLKDKEKMDSHALSLHTRVATEFSLERMVEGTLASYFKPQ